MDLNPWDKGTTMSLLDDDDDDDCCDNFAGDFCDDFFSDWQSEGLTVSPSRWDRGTMRSSLEEEAVDSDLAGDGCGDCAGDG